MPNGGSSFRSVYVGPYDVNGDLRQEWIDETTEIVDLGELQQPGNCPRCRAESEYWELGDSFVYPPGWWMSRANDFARSLDLDLKASLQLIVGTSITVFDAGIAAWDMKYAFDSVRPVTAVNELFYGTTVSDWTGTSPGNKVANLDERDFWRPYQLKRNASPPFPDVPSGHSVFSTSASVVLRGLLRTNEFDFVSEPFACRFDTDGGFDGDESNGNENATLDFKTISQAADAAGYSRLLGGFHMMQGNIVGLEMGAKVGHSSLQFLRRIFGEDDLGLDPVRDVNTDIVFGTGRNDDLLVAPCGSGPTEVYAFYGDDVLESSVSGECGPVSLFGGFGTDTFRIGGDAARATVQDYEAGEPILLLREAGAVTYALNVGMTPTTTVLVDGAPAFDLSGIWEESDLDIQFSDVSGKNVRRVTAQPTVQTTVLVPSSESSGQASDLPTAETGDLPTVETSDLPTIQSSGLSTEETSDIPTVQNGDLPTIQTSGLSTEESSIHSSYYDSYYASDNYAPLPAPVQADMNRLFPSQVEG